MVKLMLGVESVGNPRMGTMSVLYAYRELRRDPLVAKKL